MGCRCSLSPTSLSAGISPVVPWIRALATSRSQRLTARFAVSRSTIRPSWASRLAQRNVEALPKIPDEPLHLALCLRPIRRAQPGPEPVVAGEVEKARMEAVSTAAVAVPLDDDDGALE